MVNIQFPHQFIAPLIASALALGSSAGCRQVGKLVNDEEVERFRQEGIAAGQGLQGPDFSLPKLPEPVSAPEPAPRGLRQPATAEQMVRARLQCRANEKCLEETRRQLESLGPDSADALLEVAAGQYPVDLRVEALRSLGWLRLSGARRGLQRLVADGEPTVAREAIWALGQLADPDSVDVLAEQIGGRHPKLREAAVDALGNLPTPAAVQALASAWSRADPELRAALAMALGRTGLQEAVGALRSGLRDPSPLVRAEVRTALARLGENTAAEDSELADPALGAASPTTY